MCAPWHVVGGPGPGWNDVIIEYNEERYKHVIINNQLKRRYIYALS